MERKAKMRKNILKRTSAMLLAAGMALTMLAGCGGGGSNGSGTSGGSSVSLGNPDDTYYMVTFLSTIEFWDDCWRGFEDAAAIYGTNVKYTGAQAVDLNEEVTVLEQVIATNPTGIAITCTDADGLKDPINKAIEQGIEVVCFDSDSSESNRSSILATGNANATETLTDAVIEEFGGSGDIAMIYGAGTPTYEARAEGIRNSAEKHDGVNLVAEGNYNGEQEDAARAVASIIQANPNIKAIITCNAGGSLGAAAAVREAGKEGQILVAGVDTDGGIYEAIDSGEVFAAAQQGAYNMGFWSMQFLFCTANDLVNPVEGWRENGLSPLPASVDTGVNIVTKENLSAFWEG